MSAVSVDEAWASVERRRQAVWDQLFARAWIEELSFAVVLSTYSGIFGDVTTPFPAHRVPLQLAAGQPVRAIIAANCPKLSAWLWKQKLAYLRTNAGEDRVVRLLAQREFRRDSSMLSRAEYGKQRYQRAEMQARRMGLDNSSRATNWKHEWDVTK